MSWGEKTASVISRTMRKIDEGITVQYPPFREGAFWTRCIAESVGGLHDFGCLFCRRLDKGGLMLGVDKEWDYGDTAERRGSNRPPGAAESRVDGSRLRP
jgi:hypothetical protein